MTCEKLIPVMLDAYVRNALADIAAGFTRSPSMQKTLLSYAWIEIAERPGNYVADYYIGVGYAVMRHKWEIYYMPEPKGRPSNSASNQRAVKKLKKFIKSKD